MPDRVVSPTSEIDEDEDGYDDFAFSDGTEEEEEGGEGATEDDVLDLAMRVATGEGRISGQHGLDDGADTDDEEIVYPTRVAHASQATFVSHTPSPPVQHASLPGPPGLGNTGVNKTASDLLLQVLQGNPMDLRAPTSTFPGSPAAAQPTGSTAGHNSGGTAGLAGRSIWSGSAMPPPSFSTPGAQHRAHGLDLSGLVQTQSTEALFNSMPNESQQPAGQRVSSSFSPFGSIGQKAQALPNPPQAHQTVFSYQSRPLHGPSPG